MFFMQSGIINPGLARRAGLACHNRRAGQTMGGAVLGRAKVLSAMRYACRPTGGRFMQDAARAPSSDPHVLHLRYVRLSRPLYELDDA